MAQFDAAAVRQRLEEDRDRLNRDIYARTQGDQAVTTTDPASDAGGLASEQADNADALSDYERTQAEVVESRSMLEQVNAALARLDAGAYGICARCGKEIGARRLAALPYVTLCIECQEIVEREQASSIPR
ncbi:MAG: TraR/DksA family transcriptional regulator [Ktedonobacterales bacterium]